MALKIFKAGNLVAVQDDKNKGEYIRYYNPQNVHYAYNTTTEHYFIYARQTSLDPLEHWQYPLTQIQQENGRPLNSNQDLADYLNGLLGGAEGIAPATIDAAGKLRVSQSNGLVDIKQTIDDQPILYSRVNIGGATQVYDNSRGGVVMSVTSNSDKAIAQQKFWNPYLSGSSQQAIITFDTGGAQSGVIKEIGYFDSDTSTPFNTGVDGILLRSEDSTVSLVIVKGDSETAIPQADWNMDTASWLDLNNFSVFAFDFLYLGGTGVMFGFYKGRDFVPVHVYDHANIESTTFLVNPSKPVRYQITSTGGAGSMTQICAQVATENEIGDLGRPNFFHAVNFQANTAGNIYAVVGIRLKDAYRSIAVLTKGISMLARNNDDSTWVVCMNPTITGPAISWGTSDDLGTVSDSSLEVAIGTGGAAGNFVSDIGTRIDAGSFQGNGSDSPSIKSEIRQGQQIDGTMDEVWLLIRPATSNLDIDCTLKVTELI